MQPRVHRSPSEVFNLGCYNSLDDRAEIKCFKNDSMMNHYASRTPHFK